MGCECEYCRQRRARQKAAEPACAPSTAWLISLLAFMVSLAIFGMCVSLLLRGHP